MEISLGMVAVYIVLFPSDFNQVSLRFGRQQNRERALDHQFEQQNTKERCKEQKEGEDGGRPRADGLRLQSSNIRCC